MRGAAGIFVWACVALTFAGVVLFGAVQAQYGSLLAGLVLCCAGVALLRTPAEERPGWLWLLAVAAFPLWLTLQILPAPLAVVRALSPQAAAWWSETWSGPLHGCRGEEILGAPPSLVPLSVDPAATREFLFQVFAALVLFLAARSYFARRPGEQRRLAVAVAGFAGLQAFYGVSQWLSETPRVLWVTKQFQPGNASGTLINRNHFAMVLYIGLGCALWLLASRLAGRRTADPARENAIRATLALAIAAPLAGVLASKSRAGLAAAGVVLLAGLVVLLRRGRTVALVAVGALVVLAVPVLLSVAPDLNERLSALPDEWTGEASRGAVLRLSRHIVADFPLFGVGGASFELAFARYRPQKIMGLYDYAHNDYLQVLVEAGVAGFALAVAPVALYVVAVIRARRRRVRGETRGELPFPWPVYAALAMLALHELVDFPLQLPALAFLAALVAGGFAPASSARPAGRPTAALAILALVVCLPAILHSAARWPIVGDVLSIPDLPDVRQTRARAIVNASRAPNAPKDLICRALPEQARAQGLRPLSARYALNHAQFVQAAAAKGAVAPQAEETLQEETRRLSHKVRQVDPWNAWFREQLMEISLALGDLDLAVADAKVAAEINPVLSDTIVREWTKIGLPTAALPEILPRSPESMKVLLQTFFDQKDMETAAQLVPERPPADPEYCENSGLVRFALEKIYKTSAEEFLLRCLDSPAARNNEALQEELEVAMVVELIARNEDARAENWLARLKPGPNRQWQELTLAERRRDWSNVVRIAEQLLGGPGRPRVPESEGWLRYRLGKAYAMNGQLGRALRQLKDAQRLHPELDLDAVIANIEMGRNPF